jgi:hypothetical protein
MPTLLLTLAAIFAFGAGCAIAAMVIARRAFDRLSAIEDTLAVLCRVSETSSQKLNNVASKVDPTALELAARQARRDARRRRNARAA